MPNDWAFVEPRNLLVFTLRQIADDDAPVLHVSHNSDDGAWQFMGWETPLVEDGVLVCLEHLVDKDPSLSELADLPLGWRAWRPTVREPWVREVDPDDSNDDTGCLTVQH